MKKLIISITVLIWTTALWSQSEICTLLSSHAWRGFVTQEVDGWDSITTGHYMNIYFNNSNVQMDGSSYTIYGSREVSLPFEDEDGYITTYTCKTNFSGTFDSAAQTFDIKDYEFVYANDLPEDLYFMLDHFLVTIYVDESNNQFMLLKGHQLDENGYPLIGTDVFFTTDPNYSPWND
jgi:hypothetical protein